MLLLAVAVQSKANERIIREITSLDYQVQRDLMFFIETTLAKVKSHAIMAGTFTSGKRKIVEHVYVLIRTCDHPLFRPPNP